MDSQDNYQVPYDSNSADPNGSPNKSSIMNRFFNFIGHHHFVATVVVVLAITAIGSTLLLASHAATPALLYDDSFKPQDDPIHGLVYEGLGLRKTTDAHPCKGLFEAAAASAIRQNLPVCTHGPDPAPYDVAKFSTAIAQRVKSRVPITKAESSQLLNQAFTSAGGVSTNALPTLDPDATTQSAAGQPATPQKVVAAPYSYGFAPFSVPDPQCYGTGSDGRRVQLVYMHQTSQPDNLSILQNLILYAAQKMDASMLNSSNSVGSDLKRIRFVTDSNCQPTILDISSSDPTDFSTMIQSLRSAGDNGNRIYEVYVDNLYNNSLPWCGLGSLQFDDTPGQTNLNNTITQYAAIYSGCWGYADAHELGHTLGAVQDSAPNATTGGHCLDGQDIMCYGDLDNAHGANGRLYSGWHCINNPTYSPASVYDCGNDDYFNTTHPKTGYLATHWNIANNVALQTVGTLGPPVITVSDPAGQGAWTVNTQGNVVPSGGAPYFGSMLGRAIQGTITSLIPTSTGRGYTITTDQGATYPFGDAVTLGPSQSVVFTPTDDSYVVFDSQANSGDGLVHGTEPTLTVNNPQAMCNPTDPSPCDTRYHHRIFLKYVVTGISGHTLVSVALNFALTSCISVPKQLTVYRAADTSWSEGSLTWTNQPPFVSYPLSSSSYTPSSCTNVSNPQQITYINSTDLGINGDGTYSFVLDDTTANLLSMSSKEGGNPPKLAITYR